MMLDWIGGRTQVLIYRYIVVCVVVVVVVWWLLLARVQQNSE